MNIGGCACGGINCPHCNPNLWAHPITLGQGTLKSLTDRIAELETACQEWNTEYETLRAENARLRELLDTAKVIERDAVFEARITQLESDNSTIREDAWMVEDENKRLRRIAEAAVRYLTHQDYIGLLKALRAEGYFGGNN